MHLEDTLFTQITFTDTCFENKMKTGVSVELFLAKSPSSPRQ